MKAQVPLKSAGPAEKCRTWEKVQVLQVLLFVLLLAGCAGRETEVRAVRVGVPVQVPCRTQEVAVPPWAAAGLKKSDGLELKVRALLAERRQRIGYERQLLASVSACR
ncbi:hypothetical protein [Pseudomonas chlororaphis]|uniref:hypothetical protein n=1 Tax=Pseudomonas chlororaphis TaxID=587753 RepID=UPI000586B5AC|nr:hypothetical protein [Pseudomonas chlororaphis]